MLIYYKTTRDTAQSRTLEEKLLLSHAKDLKTLKMEQLGQTHSQDYSRLFTKIGVCLQMVRHKQQLDIRNPTSCQE